MEGEGTEIEEPIPVKLDTEVRNSIRHTFEALQLSNGKNSMTGEVAKSKLQVLCATISRDVGISYSSDDLDNFKQEKKSLSCGEFVDYLEDELLPKGGAADLKKHHELCWTIVSQTFFKPDEHMLTENETYKQWLIFNILDIDETSKVHKEELGLLLEKVCHAMGKVWNPSPLNDLQPEVEELTFWQYLECLEKQYLVGCDKSMYQEALEEIVDYVVNEVLMQGYITKKGHMVKSTKNRWFVLKPVSLTYYTNRTCSDKKGEIAINSSTKVVAIPDNKKYRFNVTCGDSKTLYDVEVRDQRTKQEWLVSLQKAIANSGGESVQRKERLQRRLDRNAKKLAKLEEERLKREQESLLMSQQKELELLRQKYSDAEAQALIEAENLQDEIRRREELEKLHSELQLLLLAEKEAREAEAKAKALQDELLINEKKRLEEMERLKAEKEQLLQEELKKRESLEERQKLQDKLLEEERQRLEELEKERQAAEQAMKEANAKLHAAEEASRKAAEEAKKKAREITTCTGLARPIGPHIPSFVTHRGVGAFCEEDFEKLKKRQKVPPSVLPKPKRPAANGESTEGQEEENAEKENEQNQTTEENLIENGVDEEQIDSQTSAEIHEDSSGCDKEGHRSEETVTESHAESEEKGSEISNEVEIQQANEPEDIPQNQSEDETKPEGDEEQPTSTTDNPSKAPPKEEDIPQNQSEDETKPEGDEEQPTSTTDNPSKAPPNEEDIPQNQSEDETKSEGDEEQPTSTTDNPSKTPPNEEDIPQNQSEDETKHEGDVLLQQQTTSTTDIQSTAAPDHTNIDVKEQDDVTKENIEQENSQIELENKAD